LTTFWAEFFPEVSSGSKFWTDFPRDGNGVWKTYARPDIALGNSSFPRLEVGDLSDRQKSCFSLRYRKDTKTFYGEPEYCSQEIIPLCYSLPLKISDCSGNYTKSNHTDDVAKLKKILDPQERLKVVASVAQSREFVKASFRSLDMEKAYKGIFELMWYAQLPCFGVQGFSKNEHEHALLKKCIWKGVDVPCSAIFSKFPTDKGMCCVFNMQNADQIYESSVYPDQMVKLQERDRKNAFQRAEVPKDYISNKEPVSANGISMGLTVILDAHSDLIQSSSIQEDFQGFYAIVSSRETQPLVDSKSVRIRAGNLTKKIYY
jgi:hypothetical protein